MDIITIVLAVIAIKFIWKKLSYDEEEEIKKLREDMREKSILVNNMMRKGTISPTKANTVLTSIIKGKDKKYFDINDDDEWYYKDDI